MGLLPLWENARPIHFTVGYLMSFPPRGCENEMAVLLSWWSSHLNWYWEIRGSNQSHNYLGWSYQNDTLGQVSNPLTTKSTGSILMWATTQSKIQNDHLDRISLMRPLKTSSKQLLLFQQTLEDDSPVLRRLSFQFLLILFPLFLSLSFFVFFVSNEFSRGKNYFFEHSMHHRLQIYNLAQKWLYPMLLGKRL